MLSDDEYEAWLAKQKADKEAKEAAKATAPQPPDTSNDASDDAAPTPAEDPMRAHPLAGVMGGPGQIEFDADAEDEPIDAPVVDIEPPDEATVAAHKEAMEKKADAVWYAVVGVAMLFMSGFHWGIAVGGVLMVVYGASRYTFYSRRAKALYDPWDDEDIDAWEQDQMA